MVADPPPELDELKLHDEKSPSNRETVWARLEETASNAATRVETEMDVSRMRVVSLVFMAFCRPMILSYPSGGGRAHL
jgi:hypothetical protein